MAINDCVISSPDPGAVPGASLICPLSLRGIKVECSWGRNRIDGCVKAVLLLGMVPPSSDYCLGANDNEMALAA